MTEQTLYYKKGTSEASLDKLIKELNTANPEWYWYEPKPESLIGTHHDLPVPSLLKGIVNIPKGIEFSELMVFYPNASITVIPENNQYRYFYWSEKNNATDATEEMAMKTMTAEKKPAIDSYLLSPETLENQYGITYNNTNGLPEKLCVTEYYKDNHRIAWTIGDAK